MTNEAKRVVETIKQAFSVFADMELPVEEHVCMLSHDAAMTLIDELERVERERDALKNDLMLAASGDDGLCGICNDQENAIGGVCRGMCELVNNSDCFEWRGMQEAE